MTTIEQVWQTFAFVVRITDKNSIQYSEMRKAFYAGYCAAFSRLTNDIFDMPEDLALEAISEVETQLENFVAELQNSLPTRKN